MRHVQCPPAVERPCARPRVRDCRRTRSAPAVARAAVRSRHRLGALRTHLWKMHKTATSKDFVIFLKVKKVFSGYRVMRLSGLPGIITLLPPPPHSYNLVRLLVQPD